MHERGAVLLPPLEVEERRTVAQAAAPDPESSSSTSSPGAAVALPDMSCMSPLLQAHFLSLMSTTSSSTTSATGCSDESDTTRNDRSRRHVAQEAARLAMAEIAAMQRAVGELEHYVAAGARQQSFALDDTVDTSDSSDDDEEEDNNGQEEWLVQAMPVDIIPVAATEEAQGRDSDNKRRRV